MNCNPQQVEDIIRYRDGIVTKEEDTVVSEQPITIKINGEEFVTLVCTPEYIEDMVIGYLASEGIIRQMDDIRQMRVDEGEGFVHITVEQWSPLHRQLFAKRYVTSCCGASRHGFVYVNDARTAKHMPDRQVLLNFNDCFRLMEELQQGAELFQRTGGVHSAALCNADGILLARNDIGRHNALDKIYGYCLSHHMNAEGQIIAFSGRLSSEILLKAAKIGCAVVLSKSAPTALALELAEQLGITTVGFIRGHSCNVYTHPERISGCSPVPP